MVDTGAAKSCISDNVCRRLRKVITPANGHLLRMGNGELVQPLGCASVSILIAGVSYTVVFLVVSNCVADVILGWDFLTSTDAFINCARGELELSCIDPVTDHSHSTNMPLRTNDDLLLPPLSALAVALTADPSFIGTSGLLEPVESQFCEEKYSRFILHRISSRRQCLSLPHQRIYGVANTSPEQSCRHYNQV